MWTWRDNVYKYVKRCIGLPGDNVRIENRKVLINNEEYLLPEGGQFLSQEPSSESYIDDSIFMNLGKLHGLYISWHENGQPEMSGDYKNGKKYGKWNYWDADGNEILSR